MKVIKTVTSTRLVEIGPMDAHARLPMEIRLRHKMKSVCKRCGKDITDEFFIAGFKSGHPNMMFHEACIPTDQRGAGR